MKWLLLLLSLLSVWANLVPKCEETKCSPCIQMPSCVWCKKGNQSQHCLSDLSPKFESWKRECGEENLLRPSSTFDVIKNQELTSNGTDFISLQPQEIDVRLRIHEAVNITVTYKNSRDHPTDIYYLVDGSRSMSNDHEVLSKLASDLVNSISNVTKDLYVGYGVFTDKPVLPYTSTVTIEERNKTNHRAVYGFTNFLPLTSDFKAFQYELNQTVSTMNDDQDEGGFDALMQVLTCEQDINWRNISLKVIVFSTDAGSHFAGDGKLGGIVQPNDMSCHLDASGSYSVADKYDYPSVSQIKKIIKDKNMNLIFAITDDRKPLYERLVEQIPGAKLGVIEADSSNVVGVLTNIIEEIVKKVELGEREHNDHLSVKYFSKCLGDVMEERSNCDDLKFDDEVEFTVQLTLIKCPEKDFTSVLEIQPDGRESSVKLNLMLECECQCEVEGKPGYVPNAPLCGFNGDSQCGVCECHDGFQGGNCQCSKGSANVTVSEEQCKKTNTSAVCSGSGECECGKCKCNEHFTGDYCSCDSRKCGQSGNLCSGHGDCDCDRCICIGGWTGDLCDCSPDTDKCTKPGKDVCSGQGTCNCNRCKCNSGYQGQYCEDCPTCLGVCQTHQPCVLCELENSDASECEDECQDYNITKVEEAKVQNDKEKACSFIGSDDCSIDFIYTTSDTGTTIRVSVNCPEPINILWVIIGVVATILVIGLLTLILWKIYAVMQDRREYQKFQLSLGDENVSSNMNPLYTAATTHVANPLFDPQKPSEG